MKSLLISGRYFPPETGGIANFMAGVASELGPDRICCLTGVRAEGGAAGELGPRVYRRPAAFARILPLQLAAWGATSVEIAMREHPRVVQLATLYDRFFGEWMRRWLGLPVVVYAHGNEVLDALRGPWPKHRLALRQADMVLANSRFTRDLVLQAGTKPDRIAVVHPGCDVSRFKPRPPRPELRARLLGDRLESVVILSVGNLVARKGHDMVLRALTKLRASVPDITYLVVGDGPHRPELEQLAAASGVRDRVIFAGRIPDADLPDVYALGDVFVLPSRQDLDGCDVEGFGLVYLEANACGRPVVGGRSGGVADAVVDGVTGFLVDPTSPDEIAESVRRLLTDSSLSAKLAEQGRARVAREFTWTAVGRRVSEVLDAVAGSRAGSPTGERFARP